MSKMGISTIASYKGAQIFECLGMADEVVDACFVGTASRIAGVGFHTLASDQLRVHAMAYGSKFMSASMADAMALPNPGDYHWRSAAFSCHMQGLHHSCALHAMLCYAICYAAARSVLAVV